MTMSRPLASQNLRTIDGSDYNTILVAHGTSASFAQHSEDGRRALRVNWATGAVKDGPRSLMVVVHGVLMFLGWGVFFPVGILVGRFAKHSKSMPCGTPIWFQVHRIAQTLGLLCTVAGVVVIIVFQDDNKVDHFRVTHSRLGLAILIAAWLQPVNACFRGHKTPKSTRRRVWEFVHKGIGYLAVLLSIPVVLLGLHEVEPDASDVVVGLYVALSVLWVLLWIAFSLRRSAVSPEKKQPVTSASAVPEQPSAAAPRTDAHHKSVM